MIEISIIIPIYNVEKYIGDCLKSVLSQTFADYEIICVNDASTDNSMRIVNEFANRDERIKVIEHSINRGLSAARNTGLREANGKYIFFADSDDMIEPMALQELFGISQTNRLDIVYFNMSRIYEKDVNEKKISRKKVLHNYQQVYSGQELFCLFSKVKGYKIEVWRQFFRKDFLNENALFFYEGILHEDNLFSFLCAMKAQRVMDIDDELYIYRQHRGSIMSKITTERMKSMYIVCMEIFKYWDSNDFSIQVNKAIARYFEFMYKTFLRYKEYIDEDIEFDMGTYALKSLYALQNRTIQPDYVELSKEALMLLEEAEHIILFGAGAAAVDIIRISREKQIKIDEIAVSCPELNPSHLGGLKIKNIKDCLDCRESAVVILGVTGKYSEKIKYQLEEMGFKHILIPDEISSNYQ